MQLHAVFGLPAPLPAPLHPLSTDTALSLQSTIVYSIRVGISEVKLCSSIDTQYSEALFRRLKLSRRRSCEIVKRSAKPKMGC
ncbi:hypothetical protein EVAR_48659_1 [Eumeta japonica]|uniref:Uncharacterized protein n=1 Tax=Eumeta variegata TaxID=151549 RepID=A0A4C1X7D5_EUMVA|nr:hypothetical protein EVAR_48659_1 [Eumeta japonica]